MTTTININDLPIIKNIKIPQGDDLKWAMIYENVDATTLEIFFTVLKNKTDSYDNAVIKLTEADMTTTVDGLIEFTVRMSDSTPEPLEEGLYYYNLQITNAGFRRVFYSGCIDVIWATHEDD